MQYTVKKTINNKILRVVDPTGCELIVTGRGLGFGVKPGYKIEAETVERSYRMTSAAMQIFGRRGRLHCAAHRQRRAQHHHERGERCHSLCGWLRAGGGILLQLPF